MTNAEAIDSMNNLNELISITESEHESVRLAISALNKQIAANVDTYGEDDDIYMYCPRCEAAIYDLHECGFDYCPYCGQNIVWPTQLVN